MNSSLAFTALSRKLAHCSRGSYRSATWRQADEEGSRHGAQVSGEAMSAGRQSHSKRLAHRGVFSCRPAERTAVCVQL
jgi:hypothetical protein